MCGIAGVRRFDRQAPQVDVLRGMAQALRHRGPDEEGVLTRRDVGFAHRRLSIIDLGGSQQPMSSADGTLHVCFNGEILNYRQVRAETPYDYRTDGDTEVLLAVFREHGPSGVSRLMGQFAYALYDESTDDLWLFRDRMGILPLYYYFDGRQLLFSSEVKSILAALPERPAVDEDSLVHYLERRYVPAPWTMFAGVRKLLPGHYLRVSSTGPDDPVPYHQLPGADEEDTALDERTAVARLEDVLQQSIERNLVADVPVGAYLSGGVDSSLIVSLAARARRSGELLTFAAGFGEGSVDELPFARAVSEHVGSRHHEVVLGAHDYEADLMRLTWHRDAPISEASDIAVHRLAAMAREHVKVVLSGEGSDELFAGYPKHAYATATRRVGVVPGAVRTPGLDLVQRRLPPGRWRLRTAVRALAAGSESDRYEEWFASFSEPEARALLSATAPRRQLRPVEVEGDALRRMLLTDVARWLPDNLLERADRMSMAVSLETRPPFLDPAVVDFAFRLPSSFKRRHGQSKWIVKALARQTLPASIVDRPKAGFRAPLDSWFRTGLRDMAWSRLLDPGSFASSVLERQVVEDLLRRHDEGRSNESARLWNLLALEVWHDVYYRDGAPEQSRLAG